MSDLTCLPPVTADYLEKVTIFTASQRVMVVPGDFGEWINRIVSGEITADERAQAERDFPFVLSVAKTIKAVKERGPRTAEQIQQDRIELGKTLKRVMENTAPAAPYEPCACKFSIKLHADSYLLQKAPEPALTERHIELEDQTQSAALPTSH